MLTRDAYTHHACTHTDLVEAPAGPWHDQAYDNQYKFGKGQALRSARAHGDQESREGIESVTRNQ
jgi:hypothetical protein